MSVAGFSGAVGATPLIELRELSRELGRHVFGKAEFLNPGGSVKDRAARGIVDDAESRGKLQPDGTIVEGTAGNTGIALALVANERGYKTVIVVPDDQSREKIDLLRTYGSDVRVVPAVAFTNPQNYYHVARRIAEELPEGSTVVAVLADGGWKYLSAAFWRSSEVEESMASTLWW